MLKKSALFSPQTPDLSLHPLRGRHPSSPPRPLPRILTFAAPGSERRRPAFWVPGTPSLCSSKSNKTRSFQALKRQRLVASSCPRDAPPGLPEKHVARGQQRDVVARVSVPAAGDRLARRGDPASYLAPRTLGSGGGGSRGKELRCRFRLWGK